MTPEMLTSESVGSFIDYSPVPFDFVPSVNYMTGLEALGYITFVRTYAKENETYEDTVNRYLSFFKDRYPHMEKEIKKYGYALLNKLAIGSMRMMQFAGPAVTHENFRAYNCSFTGISAFEDLSDILYLLCCGAGVGVSVEYNYIDKLPIISKGKDGEKCTIPDTKEGWADSIKLLCRNPKLKFDYSLIRPKGASLSSGGTASGPEPLKRSHQKIRKILINRKNKRLRPEDVADVACLIAECVVAGGVRRSSIIVLFDDSRMLEYKSMSNLRNNTHRYMANISRIAKKESDTASKTISLMLNTPNGEPGIMLVDSQNTEENTGSNPCGEISLRNKGACNLSEIIVSNCKDEEDFYYACKAASFFGTLQAGLTDFNYISPEWAKTIREDALIGVSITGQAMKPELMQPNILQKGVEFIKKVNKETAQKIGINEAKRLTTVKPSGTTSCVFGCSSGIHAAHSPLCIRRMRVTKDSDLGKKLLTLKNKLINFSDKPDYGFVCEDEQNERNVVVQFPAEFTGIYRKDESALGLLNRAATIYENWILPGHIEGQQTNNVSMTVSYKEHEKEEVIDWMRKNQDKYRGISVLPYDCSTYVQPPYEEVSEEEFKKYLVNFPKIDWVEFATGIKSTKTQTVACAGGACELHSL